MRPQALLLFVVSFELTSSAVVPRSNKELQNVQGTCNTIIKDKKNGIIASPGFPHQNYTKDLNCVYEIYVKPGFVIAFRSVFVNIQEKRPLGICDDYVALYLSGSIAVNEPPIYCGNDAIPFQASTGSSLLVQFASDDKITGMGFSIEWFALKPEDRPSTANCNFDEALPLCAGWMQSNNGDLDWSFARKETPSVRTGPHVDHTTGNGTGRYAFVEASGKLPGTTALLFTAPFSIDEDACLGFWYHAHGDGHLQIAIAFEDFGETIYLDNKWFNTGPDWQQAQVQLPVLRQTIQVGFEATVRSYRSDIAIDDVIVTNGKCIISDHVLSKKAGNKACAGDLIFQECASPCTHTCSDGQSGPPCKLACMPRCSCPFHAPVLHQGACIEYVKCPAELKPVMNKSDISSASRQARKGIFMLLNELADWHEWIN